MTNVDSYIVALARTHKTTLDIRSYKWRGVSKLLVDNLEQVYITSLEGLGSSYRMKGYFSLKSDQESSVKISFEGVAFGGNYGGHNVNVNLTEEGKESLTKATRSSQDEIEDLLSEVQRRLLNNEMIVEYDSIKPEEREDVSGLGV